MRPLLIFLFERMEWRGDEFNSTAVAGETPPFLPTVTGREPTNEGLLTKASTPQLPLLYMEVAAKQNNAITAFRSFNESIMVVTVFGELSRKFESTENGNPRNSVESKLNGKENNFPGNGIAVFVCCWRGRWLFWHFVIVTFVWCAFLCIWSKMSNANHQSAEGFISNEWSSFWKISLIFVLGLT